MKKFFVSSIIGMAFLIGCGGNQPQPKNKNVEVSVPWKDFCDSEVNKIRQNGGIAACKCEETDNLADNFSMTIAENKARKELGKILLTRVEVLSKGYQDKARNGKKVSRGSVNSEAMRAIVDNNLKGSYPIAHKIFRTENNTYQMCAVVALEPSKVKNILKEIAKQQGIEDDKILYEQFKAKKAQEELKREINKNIQ